MGSWNLCHLNPPGVKLMGNSARIWREGVQRVEREEGRRRVLGSSTVRGRGSTRGVEWWSGLEELRVQHSLPTTL